MTAPARNGRETATGTYRVLRSFPGVGGRAYQPGEVIETDKQWPWNRATNLVNQRYLEPVASVRKGATT